MNKSDFATILVKSAQLIDKQDAEIASLKEKLARYELLSTSDGSLSKIAEEIGEDVDHVIDQLKDMKPEQRRLFEKIASADFSLGAASDEDVSQDSAEQRLVNFMSN